MTATPVTSGAPSESYPLARECAPRRGDSVSPRTAQRPRKSGRAVRHAPTVVHRIATSLPPAQTEPRSGSAAITEASCRVVRPCRTTAAAACRAASSRAPRPEQTALACLRYSPSGARAPASFQAYQHARQRSRARAPPAGRGRLELSREPPRAARAAERTLPRSHFRPKHWESRPGRTARLHTSVQVRTHASEPAEKRVLSFEKHSAVTPSRCAAGTVTRFDAGCDEDQTIMLQSSPAGARMVRRALVHNVLHSTAHQPRQAVVHRVTRPGRQRAPCDRACAQHSPGRPNTARQARAPI